jgi:hypothetical protein
MRFIVVAINCSLGVYVVSDVEADRGPRVVEKAVDTI